MSWRMLFDGFLTYPQRYNLFLERQCILPRELMASDALSLRFAKRFF